MEKNEQAFERGLQLMESLRMSRTKKRCLHAPSETEKARETIYKLLVGSSNDKQSSTVTKHAETSGPHHHKSMQSLLPCVQSHMRIPEPSISVLEVLSKPVANNLVLSTSNQCAVMKHHLLHDSCDRSGHTALQQLKKSDVRTAAS